MAGSAFVDVLIAVIMTFQVGLTTCRLLIPTDFVQMVKWKTGIAATDRIINKIIRLVVETGSLTGKKNQVFATDTQLRARNSKRGYSRSRARHRRSGGSHCSLLNASLIAISERSLLPAGVSAVLCAHHVDHADLTTGYTYSRSCKAPPRPPNLRLASLKFDRYSNTFLTNLTNRFFLGRDAGRMPRNQNTTTESTSFAFTSVFVDSEDPRSQEASHAHGDGRSSVVGRIRRSLGVDRQVTEASPQW